MKGKGIKKNKEDREVERGKEKVNEWKEMERLDMTT